MKKITLKVWFYIVLIIAQLLLIPYAPLGIIFFPLLPIIFLPLICIIINQFLKNTHIQKIFQITAIVIFTLIALPLIYFDIKYSPSYDGKVIDALTQKPLTDISVCYSIYGNSIYSIAHPVGGTIKGETCKKTDNQGKFYIPMYLGFNPFLSLDEIIIHINPEEFHDGPGKNPTYKSARLNIEWHNKERLKNEGITMELQPTPAKVGDERDCMLIEPGARDNCYLQYAISKNNVDLCNSVSNVRPYKQKWPPRYHCFKALQHCELVEDEKFKEQECRLEDLSFIPQMKALKLFSVYNVTLSPFIVEGTFVMKDKSDVYIEIHQQRNGALTNFGIAVNADYVDGKISNEEYISFLIPKEMVKQGENSIRIIMEDNYYKSTYYPSFSEFSLSILQDSRMFSSELKSVTFEPLPSKKLMQDLCSVSGGSWKVFPDICVDSCLLRDKTDRSGCGEAETEGCDCGLNKCWNGVGCKLIEYD